MTFTLLIILMFVYFSWSYGVVMWEIGTLGSIFFVNVVVTSTATITIAIVIVIALVMAMTVTMTITM